ncbi:MAG TPA: glucose-1-phosphate cytidylyltransferase [Rickettsiales bacterium]|nr:glucose-1-phosphate cytidylyltransferase [Rickettsiales bacterium]
MKAVILAGGLGTRLSEETIMRPKPMVEIGGKPILWHIMKIYSYYGINEFIICLGYKGYMIKEYFANYYRHMSDITIDLLKNTQEIHNSYAEKWKITLIDTGEETMTGGRIKRIHDYVKNEEAFCLTYGDGVANVDISKLIEFHKSHKKLATLTSVTPPGRFGALRVNNNIIEGFQEKPAGDGALINGGFFVLSPKVIEYIDSDKTTFEQEPLRNLAKDNQLMAFSHDGFWQPMDTLRDKNYLEELWSSGKACWIKK